MNRKVRLAIWCGVWCHVLAINPRGTTASERGPLVIKESIKSEVVWDGRISVPGMITVEATGTLTILPGTEVRFAPEAGLTVLGLLIAEGTPEKPVLLLPAAEGTAPWVGINLAGSASPSRLINCRITRAKGIGVAMGQHLISRCEITGGNFGITVTGDTSRPVISGNRIFDQVEAGIQFSTAASAVVTDNDIERCGVRGIGVTQGSSPEIRGNRISACENGIDLHQSVPRISDNTISECTRGIALTAVTDGAPIRGNRIGKNETGILCQQFADPEIADNTISQNKDGIFCFMGASPLIHHNDIVDNTRGIVCNQLSSPDIVDNAIMGNRAGIVLNLSSYARVHNNNITGSSLLELENMSLDWERRTGRKQARGLQQRNLNLVKRGRAMPDLNLPDGMMSEGDGVDAIGNWWGEAVTREMAVKGPAANISGLTDYYDVPTRTYEGFEGEYVQDRIFYAPWATERFSGAGRPAASGSQNIPSSP